MSSEAEIRSSPYDTVIYAIRGKIEIRTWPPQTQFEHNEVNCCSRFCSSFVRVLTRINSDPIVGMPSFLCPARTTTYPSMQLWSPVKCCLFRFFGIGK